MKMVLEKSSKNYFKSLLLLLFRVEAKNLFFYVLLHFIICLDWDETKNIFFFYLKKKQITVNWWNKKKTKKVAFYFGNQ